MNRAVKVFLACAFGAGVGAIVSLELRASLAWIGLIVGGLTGYLSYEWRQVVATFAAAWVACRNIQREPPAPEHIRARSRKVGAWTAIAALSVMNCCTLLFFGMITLIRMNRSTEMIDGDIVASIIFSSVLGLAFFAINSGDNRRASRNDEKYREQMDFLRVLSFYTFWQISVPYGIFILVRHTPNIIRFMAKVAWLTFLGIHSEARLICGVDAMIGASIGYCSGSVIIGTLVGGFLGVINYEIVTNRILIPRGYLPAR